MKTRSIALIAVGALLIVSLLIGVAAVLGRHGDASTTAITSNPLIDSVPAAPTVAIPPDLPAPPAPTGHAAQIVDPIPGLEPKKVDQSCLALSVAVDHGGRIWCGYEDSQLCFFDPATLTWHYFGPIIEHTTNTLTALAVDTHGRVWAGYAMNGVSVFDGVAWKSYGVVDGPLGEHINKIVINPKDGDVWIATNRGISRYSDKANVWSYLTRGDGLPSDDIVSIAFDSTGTAYAATADSGIALAHASDGYATWSAIHATKDVRGLAQGDGLCSDWCNDVRVIGDTVFVGTAAGLSYSRDGGTSWAFMRGRDWLKKAKGATFPPTLPAQPAVGALGEDAVTCLGEDARGHLLVGHYRTPVERLDVASLDQIGTLDATTVSAFNITRGADKTNYIATYGNGVVTDTRVSLIPDRPMPGMETTPDAQAFEKSAADAGLPAPAAPPTAAQLVAMTQRVTTLTEPSVSAVTLGTDWLTGGDCTARYGWDHENLPYFGPTGRAADIKSHEFVGPHVKGDDGRYYFFATTTSDDPRTLYFMRRCKREEGEWNDGSWQRGLYPPTFEGPDLWFDVTTGGNADRVSLYLFNGDGSNDANHSRDYLIELKPYVADKNAIDAAPTLARARARQFGPGIYAEFVVGPGHWHIKIGRNGSPNTKASGLFVDQLEPHKLEDKDHPTGPTALGGYDFRPKWDGRTDGLNDDAKAAVALWNNLDARRFAAAPVDMAYRLLAYRAVAATPGNDALKAAWRWTLPIWTPEDRKTWRDGVAEAFRIWKIAHPEQSTTVPSEEP